MSYELSIWEDVLKEKEPEIYSYSYENFTNKMKNTFHLNNFTFIEDADVNKRTAFSRETTRLLDTANSNIQIINTSLNKNVIEVDCQGQLYASHVESEGKQVGDYTFLKCDIEVGGEWDAVEAGNPIKNPYYIYSIEPIWISKPSVGTVGRYILNDSEENIIFSRTTDGTTYAWGTLLPSDSKEQDGPIIIRTSGKIQKLSVGIKYTFKKSLENADSADVSESDFLLKFKIECCGLYSNQGNLQNENQILPSPHQMLEYCKDNPSKFSYTDEQKLQVFGGSELSTKAKAENVTLTENINNIRELHFDMYTNYYDADKDTFVENPYLPYLKNEAKVKLKKDNEWYDFIIKEKVENRDENLASFVCKDANATILSKQGFEIEMADELYNNQGTLTEVAEEVLKHCDWNLGKCDEVYEKYEETFVTWKTPRNLDGISFENREYFNKYNDTPIVITQDLDIYIPYSYTVNPKKGDYIPFYIKNVADALSKDENGVIDDNNKNLWYFIYEDGDNFSLATPDGPRIKYSPLFERTTYRPGLQEYVTKVRSTTPGDETEYEMRKKTIYDPLSITKELAVNGGSDGGITGTTGWVGSIPENLSVGSHFEGYDPAKVYDAWKPNALLYNPTGVHDSLGVVLSPEGFEKMEVNNHLIIELTVSGKGVRGEWTTNTGEKAYGPQGCNLKTPVRLGETNNYTFAPRDEETGEGYIFHTPLAPDSESIGVTHLKAEWVGDIVLHTFIMEVKCIAKDESNTIKAIYFWGLTPGDTTQYPYRIHRISIYKKVPYNEYIVAPDGCLRKIDDSKTREEYLKGIDASLIANVPDSPPELALRTYDDGRSTSPWRATNGNNLKNSTYEASEVKFDTLNTLRATESWLSYNPSEDAHSKIANNILGASSNLEPLKKGDNLIVELTVSGYKGGSVNTNTSQPGPGGCNVSNYDWFESKSAPDFGEPAYIFHGQDTGHAKQLTATWFKMGETPYTYYSYILELEVLKPITEELLKEQDLFLYFCTVATKTVNGESVAGPFLLHRLSVYKKIPYEKDGKKYVVAPDGRLRRYMIGTNFNMTLEDYLIGEGYPIQDGYLTEYNIYKPSENLPEVKEDQYSYVYSGLNYPTEYKPLVYADKIRNIQIKNSNIYNALQEIAESFGVWMRLDVEHNTDGSLALDSNNEMRPIRSVHFVNEYGTDRNIGFHYGINEQNIERTANTDQIVTKLIALDNANKYGENGLCTVSRSKFNPTKDNSIFNFEYLKNSGIISNDEIENDIKKYEKEMGDIGDKINKSISQLLPLGIQKAKLEADTQTYAQLSQTAKKQLHDLYKDFHSVYGATYSSLKNEVILDGNWSGDIARNFVTGNSFKSTSTAADIGAIEYLICQNTEYSNKLKEFKDKLQKVTTEYNNLNSQLSVQRAIRDNLRREFIEKYSPFIQEGSWQSENYIDDNLYYLDAKAAFERYAKPQLSYEISVVDVSKVEGYKDYEFNVGDRTYIEDEEFLGTEEVNGVSRPKREKVMITERTSNLDDPSQDTIIVQNYRDNFAELFQKLVMDVQQLNTD